VGLTTLPSSYGECLEIWEPQLPGTLRACPGLYGDCFASLHYHCVRTERWKLDAKEIEIASAKKL